VGLGHPTRHLEGANRHGLPLERGAGQVEELPFGGKLDS
jgi:hypothetical protein